MSRRMQELQCKHEEEMRMLQARFDRTVSNYEEELQKSECLLARTSPVSSPTAGVSSQISRSNSVKSLYCDPLLESGPLLRGTRDVAYESSIISNERGLLPSVSIIY